MKSKPSSVEFHQEKKNKNLGGFMEPNVLRIHHNEEPYVEGRTESGKKKKKKEGLIKAREILAFHFPY